jgi:hypothetical protein
MVRIVSSGILLATLASISVSAAAPQRIFFTEYQYQNPKIKGMDLDGGNLSELFSPPVSEWLPVGCDYDEAAGKIYWTHGSTPGTIRRANLDGSGLELLVGGLKLPRGITLDTVNGKMYWVQAPPSGNALGLIRRANLDGTSVETVYSDDPYDPVLSYVGKPAVDPVNGYVYFCARGEIRRRPLDLSGPHRTVVRGVTTVAAIALDIASNHVYWADANTNSDYIGRANLDDTDFTVVYDNTPGSAGTSGFFDLKADLEGGRLYWTDEIAKVVRSLSLDGTSLLTLYTSPAALAPTGLTLDTDPLQPMLDCNGNGVRDLDDVTNGTSEDCNANGIPDECETDPCANASYVIDNGSDPSGHRTLSGEPVNGFEVFQPFDLASAASVLEIGLDGWTTIYHPKGFTATLFPDDGSGTFPDESAPIASTACQYRFSNNTIVWVDAPLRADLDAGRFWVRLTANDPVYAGGASYGTTGLPSFSRKLGNGQIYPSSHSIALRIRAIDPALSLEYAPAAVRVLDPSPNPSGGEVAIRCELPMRGSIACSLIDPAGRIVRTLPESSGPAGERVLRWDGRDDRGLPVGAGVYFARVLFTPDGGRALRLRVAPILTMR